jgi:hypothetical protein
VGITILEDPADKRRSLMLQQKTVCDGQSTGFECVHYTALAVKMDVPNPHHLKQGEVFRLCLKIPGKGGEVLELGDGGQDMAVYCNQYCPSDRPYNHEFNKDYEPLAPEEAEALPDPGGGRTFAPPAPRPPPELSAADADAFFADEDEPQGDAGNPATPIFPVVEDDDQELE